MPGRLTHAGPLLRALLVSLVVLAAGAALGAGGFLVEQTRVSWRPQVTATDDGWRITTSHGLRLGGAALGGEHLVWEAGPFTVLTDLGSGRSRLLGAAAFAGDASAPSASASHAAWMEVPHGAGFERVVWVYDLSEGRRTRLRGTAGISRSPALAGPVAMWAVRASGGRGWLVRGADLVSGRRFTLARTPAADDLTGGGALAAWIARPATHSAPPVISVADVGGTLRRSIAPYAEGSGGRLIGFALAAGTLVWARGAGDATDEIVSFEVGTGSTRVLATAQGVTALAAHGDLVVWAESPGGGARVVGLRLAAGGRYVASHAGRRPFVIARVPGGALTDVYAGEDLAAWRVGGVLLFDSYLQTARVP